jgi:hypothetical protein
VQSAAVTGTRRSLSCLGFAAAVVLATSSCANASSEPSTPVQHTVSGVPIGLAQNVTPSTDKVSYTSKTVNVDRATVAANLIGISPDGTFTFSGDSGPLGQLAAGKVMLLEGTDVEDVTGVSHSGGHLVVKTAAPKLTDLVQNGTIAFSAPMSMANMLGITESGDVIQPTLAPPPPSPSLTDIDSPSPSGAQLTDASCTGVNTSRLPTMSYTGKALSLWNYRVGFAFNRCASKLTYAVTLCVGYTLGSATGRCISPAGGAAGIGTALQMEVTGDITWQDIDTQLVVKSGAISKDSITFDHLSCTYKMVYAASAGTSVTAISLPAFRIPVGVEFPIEVGPIPFYVKVQAALLVHLGLSSKNSVLQASSDASANVSGGGAQSDTAEAATDDTDGDASGGVSPGPTISPAAAAVTLALQMPRLGFGLGFKIVNILAYLDFVWSFGMLAGSAIALNPCTAYALKVSYGFQVEASAGNFKATFPKVTLKQWTLAMYPKTSVPLGCPAL